jgi:D-3-phosphoglycerate dehydrogenase
MDRFRIGVSGALLPARGQPAPFPSYDVRWLDADPRIETVALPLAQPLPGETLAGLDAAILLGERVTAEGLAGGRRLTLVARMGVGYDTLAVGACTAAEVAITITPPGVRRPMAVAILTFMLALAGRLVEKDRIARGGAPAWETRTRHHGLGLIGRTLAQIGMGNIGAEVFRIAQPLGLRFIAHDPYVDPALAERLGVTLLPLDEVFRQADFLSVSCPLTEETRHLVNAERLALM